MESSHPSPSRYKLAVSAALLLLLGTLAWGTMSQPVHPLHWGSSPNSGSGYDYFHYYLTVNALDLGIPNVYSSQDLQSLSQALSRDLVDGGWQVADNHPLPFYLAYIPLAKLDFHRGYTIHLWMQICLWLAAVAALCRYCLSNRLQAWVVTVLLGCWAFALGIAGDNIVLGQIGMALTFTLVFAFILDAVDYQRMAGIMLAMAILMKLYPALLLVYFWQRRRYETMVWTFGTLIALGISAGLQWGFGHYLNYWQMLTAQLEYQTVVSNQSLMALLGQTGLRYSPWGLKIANLLLISGASAGLWLAGKRWGLAGCNRALLHYSAFVLVSMILSPLSWGHHHMLLVIPIVAFLSILLNATSEIPVAWNLGGAAAICLLLASEGETVSRAWVKVWHYQACCYYIPLGLMLLILAFVLLSWRQQGQTSQGPETP